MRALRFYLFLCLSVLLFASVSMPSSVYANGDSASSVAAVAGSAELPASVADVAPVERSALGEFLDSVPGWLQALSLLISAFAAIAALTPTPKDDGVLLVLRKIIDLLALNFGGAKNARSSKNSGDFR